MTKNILLFVFLHTLLLCCAGSSAPSGHWSIPESQIPIIYNQAGLNGKVSYDSFKKACLGYNQIKYESSVIMVVDFSLPSRKKRGAVVDLKNKKLLYHTYVSHGSNSGGQYATQFSNVSGSHQSSLGFYKTGQTYQGKYGYSLKLHGLEKGINDRAFRRYIVIHPANYATEQYVREHQRLGRSWGCPAIPPGLSTKIINVIKDGGCLFIYAKQESYFKKSRYF